VVTGNVSFKCSDSVSTGGPNPRQGHIGGLEWKRGRRTNPYRISLRTTRSETIMQISFTVLPFL